MKKHKRILINDAAELARTFRKHRVNTERNRYCIPLSDNSNIIIKKILRSHADVKRKTMLVKWNSELVVAKCFFGSQISKAKQEINNNALIADEIKTPKILDILTDASGSITILLFEYIESTVNNYTSFKNNNFSKNYRTFSKIIDQIVLLLNKGYIKDTVPSNFIINNNEVFLIDFLPFKKINSISIFTITRSVKGFITSLINENTKRNVLLKVTYLYLMKKHAKKVSPLTFFIFKFLINLEYVANYYFVYKFKSMKRGWIRRHKA